MSNIYREISDDLYLNSNFINASDKLFEAYVHKVVDEEYDVEPNIIRKLAGAVQILYRSESEEYINEGAVVLSMLLGLYGNTEPPLVHIADNLFSYSGDFPNISVLDKMFEQYKFVSNVLDESINELRRDANTVAGIEFPLTDYQRTLWRYLQEENDIVTVAPTSTGKTYIILHYLLQKVAGSNGSFAVVIVPTRALISEISSKIYKIAKEKGIEEEIQICTVPKEGPFKDKSIFVMTQERLFELLLGGDLNFDYLFIDEAHNISDKGRGVLLHLTLQKVIDNNIVDPQIIISMPSPMYQDAFDSVFNETDFYKQATIHSPVAKLFIPVHLRGKKLELTRLDRDNKVSIDKNFTGDRLAKIVYRLGKNESNIIYQGRTDYCEKVAEEISSLIKNNVDSQALKDASDYVEKYIHREFSLAANLRKGVAFHYGPLPGAVRTMIEQLAHQGEIKYIVCTSTLAEGVNLPAKNLFLQNPVQQIPYKPTEKIDRVKLNNITGRAGRMLEHFSGNIFLVKYDNWTFKDYFDEDDNDKKIATYFKLINEDLEGVITALKGRYDYTDDAQYTYYTIANKMLKEYVNDNLNYTFKAKDFDLSDNDESRLRREIEKAYERIKIDMFTMEANPTIGYIQQNNLYESLSQKTDIASWLLPHPKSKMVYEQLVKVCTELKESGIFSSNNYSIEHISVIARQWMRGEPLRKIILQQISYDKSQNDKLNCNKSVRDVIKIINDDIRFRLSSALRCYHTLLTYIIQSRNLKIKSLKLHSYIEVGGCEKRIINLVGLGLSRETALEIDRLLSKDVKIDTKEKLIKYYEGGVLSALHVITKREIESLLF